ncbi:MAG: RlmE family RNA methyltransferase [Desulfobacterales bacterium]
MIKKATRGNPWEDHYARKARKENYPARSVFKLKEIQKKVRLIRPGDRVLDLGCAPGSWTLHAAELVGPGGRVIGIDLKPVAVSLPSHARALQGDVFDMTDTLREELQSGFDVVISDMAPTTIGHRATDAARSEALCEAALQIALDHLTVGGHFLCKIFQGSDFKAFTDHIKGAFSRQRIYKPQSSRKASREIYVIGLGKR